MADPMKILISGYKSPSIAKNVAYEFKSRGFVVSTFLLDDKRHWIDKYVLKRLNSFFRMICSRREDFPCLTNTRFNPELWYQKRFARLFYDFDPDIVFVIQGKPVFSIESFLGGRAKFFGWWIEPSDIELEILRNTRGFVRYYSYSLKSAEILRANQVHCGYLSHGYSPSIFRPLTTVSKKYDLVFVGNWSPWRDQVLVEALKVTSNVRVYGPRWQRRSSIHKALLRKVYGGNKIDETALNELYNSTKIVLNASRVQNSSGLNMRFFEVLGSGSLLLTDQAPELERHFTPDVELIVFRDLFELKDKLRRLLENSSARRAVASQGYKKAQGNHTYATLVGKLVLDLSLVDSFKLRLTASLES
jgi:glycosyltransferase involved in cell wall biosynthesis